MAGHGGKRNRSGPPADENSARSDGRGYVLSALPAEGYSGRVPAFPLPRQKSDVLARRETAVWKRVWKTPQACAWSMPSESWRIPAVAMYVRVLVRCEDPATPAALFAQMHRLADQIGLTTAGLAEMGWKVAPDELAEKRAEKSGDSADAAPARKRRLRSVDEA
jgi:hypothetical protein